MKAIISLMITMLIAGESSAQFKQASTVSLVEICDGKIQDWDHERAVINFNLSTQVLELQTDIYEVIDNVLADEDDSIDKFNGEPLKLRAQFDLPSLDFKAASKNGEVFRVNTEVTCHGNTISFPVDYTFIYAPLVTQRDASPLCNFRMDFTMSIDAKKLDLKIADNCTEIILKVQDALLNVVY